jgi:hypothetical protein
MFLVEKSHKKKVLCGIILGICIHSKSTEKDNQRSARHKEGL